MYLFTNDDYYSATYSEAEWHKNAGEYGKNYDPDLQRFGDVVAKEIGISCCATGSDMAR